MRWWLAVIALTTTALVGWAQQPPRRIWWLSQGANLNGQPADSRFPSISADGKSVVFQVGSGQNAQIWQAVWDANNATWQVNFVPVPTAPSQPSVGIHPVTSADGNHIAFASWQDYRPPQSTAFPRTTEIADLCL